MEDRGSKGSYNSSETVATDTCESPSAPLEGQAVLTTAESSLAILIPRIDAKQPWPGQLKEIILLRGERVQRLKDRGQSLCSSVVCYPCDVTLQKKKLNNWHLLSLFLCAQVHGWKLGFWLRQGSFSPVLWLLARFSSTPRHRGLSPGLLLPCAQDSVSGLLPEWGGTEEGVQRRDWQQLNLFMTYSLKWHWHIFLIVHQFVDISLTPQYTPYKEFMHRKDRDHFQVWEN